MFDWLAGLGLTAPPVAEGQAATGGLLEFLGWVAHGDRANLAGTNVADVAQSVIGVIEKVVFIKADEAVDYGEVMATMDALRAAGIEDMGLITEKPSGSTTGGGQQ